MMANQNNVQIGVDLMTGKFQPEVIYNTLQTTVAGTATAAGPMATFSLPAGARAMILNAIVINEGTSGASELALESNSAVMKYYYLPSPGMAEDSGSLGAPVLFVVNSTTAAITVGLYATSVASGNTLKGSISYVILPDYRPTL